MPHSVILQAGYTQRDLFFAAVRVQFEKFKETRDARALESPRVDGLTLYSADHKPALVNTFKDRMNTAPIFSPWSEVRDQYPLKRDAESKWTGNLSEFDKYQLANYLTYFVVQFQRDMKEFLAEAEIRQQLETMPPEEVNEFILSTATILAHVITPSSGVGIENNDAAIIFSFCNIAANKFYEQKLMQPAPIGTVDSCCDAMLHLIGLTLTQPIGNDEAIYGGMLGKAPRNASGASASEYTPEMKMQDILEAYEGLDSNVVAQVISNVAIPVGHYLIPDDAFSIDREEAFFETYYKFLSIYLEQVDGRLCHPKLYEAVLNRYWDHYVNDQRCPQWIKDSKAALESRAFDTKVINEFVISSALKKLFESFPDRIKSCSHGDSNSLENELLLLVRETAFTILQKAQQLSFGDESAEQRNKKVMLLVQDQLANLVIGYKKEKTLHAQFCSVIASKAQNFLLDAPPEALTEIAFGAASMVTMNSVARGKMLRDMFALKGAVSENLFKTTLESLLTEFNHQYEKEVLFALDNNTAFPEFYTHDMIQYYFLNQINELPSFSTKEEMLSILKSNLPLHEKLKEISEIAQQRTGSPNLLRASETIDFRDSLQCFSSVEKQDDIISSFTMFLIARKEIPDNVINIEHYRQRLALIKMQENNLILPEIQRKSFEVLFMRWVNFSKTTGDVIRKEDLNFGVSLTQEGAQHCYDVIAKNDALSVSQKQAFIETLRVACCVNHSLGGAVIFESIEKDPAIVEFAHDDDLLALLDSYERAQQGDNPIDPVIIADRIEACCPRSELQALESSAKGSFPTVSRPSFFGRKAVHPPRAVVDILLALKNQEGGEAVSAFLNSRKPVAMSMMLGRRSE